MTRAGINTDKGVNQCYHLKELLVESRIKYWEHFFTNNTILGPNGIKQEFYRQLDNYQLVPKTRGNAEVHFKAVTMVPTGKIDGGKDDVVDACEISSIGRKFFMNPKYSEYHVSDFF